MSNDNRPEKKPVIYYCAGCRQRVTRWVRRANPYCRSFCSTVGREVRLRKVKS